ncbi:MAG: hypothetical protein GWO20_12950 [Candidatus Korarchaeota archaeon]|nr:hypothetical protein [Candidatus Korarchaeota archaeon]NIU84336.1 hypothetical protein [Candidatus Thorarchaeota archaeon]NIW14455.1 hypothetical protein [Candidatus Thorarchaeota archaeon]NIW52522.1 hypothetical protein [Candidatus Korarchaeota archaeon]
MGYSISPQIKDILQCPTCLGQLEVDQERNELVCQEENSHAFPIQHGIPSFVKSKEIAPEDAKWVFEYDEKAEEYDEAIKKYMHG